MEKKKKLVVFTGAGISAESGIATFRGGNGLWDNVRIEDVCTPEALLRNRAQVIAFYNSRRKEVMASLPNEGHNTIAAMERYFDVQVVTQNVDDLHERAGSSRVLHLHGDIRYLRSSADAEATVRLEGWEQSLEARHADGSLLRPHIVFFGEAVPMFEPAVELVRGADIFVVVGTSLAVYPAASLLRYVRHGAKVYVVDPADVPLSDLPNSVQHIKQPATVGLPMLLKKLTDAL